MTLYRGPPQSAGCELSKETGRMLDLAMIAIGCASFAILILYTYACDRM
jgi:hypothetical protein